MPVSLVADPEVTSTLIAYRARSGELLLTLVDLTADLMHLASHMRADFDRCLDGDARPRLDERAFAAMPDLHPDTRPTPTDRATAPSEHLFNLYVHASDAAMALRVHTSEDAPASFSAALSTLLADLRAYVQPSGLDFSEVLRAARSAYRAEQKRAKGDDT